jgi:hypothetical protein
MLGRGDEYVGGDIASMKLAARALEKMRKEERQKERYGWERRWRGRTVCPG